MTRNLEKDLSNVHAATRKKVEYVCYQRGNDWLSEMERFKPSLMKPLERNRGQLSSP